MRCIVNLKSNPISLTIVALTGKEHQHLEKLAGKIVEIKGVEKLKEAKK